MKYPFDQLFLVCTGARCNSEERGDQGGLAIREQLKDLNKRLGRKPTVRVCSVSCLDLCDFGPNIVVQPGGVVYSHLTPETAQAVYLGVMGDAEPRPDLELREDEVAATRG